MLIIQGVRLVFLMAILVITLVFQSLQPGFINLDVSLPIFSLLGASFGLTLVYLLGIDRALKRWEMTALLFFFDSAFITLLIYFTSFNQSLFLFLYLVNIILCGFVFKKQGALILAVWTSILFSFLTILGPETKGQTLYFVVGLNNIAFFSVAYLSGILSEQLNFMGLALEERVRDLRALKNLNSLIIENIATGLVTVDRKGTILQGNRAALEILFYSGRNLMQHPLDVILPGLFRQIQEIDFGPTDRRVSKRFDWHFHHSDDEKLLLEMIVSPLRAEDGQLTGYVLTFQDLTRIRKLEYSVRQSEKLAAVGQLAAGIAHEIRNPLASISGSIQLLGMYFTGQADEEKKLMAIVLKEIDRLNNLISEFMDFVKPEKQVNDPIDLNALVKEVLELVKLNQNLRRDIVQLTSFKSTALIAGSRDKLKQALLNIIINSYQAMTDSKRSEIEVSTEESDLSVLLKIKDHGCGIDEARIKKIFDAFHTTKAKGTGLGLAMTHKIIENHGAKIFVESTLGESTEFILEFPRIPTVKSNSLNLSLADSSGPKDDLKNKRGFE
jgi:two-component system sensor histidine kinase PilS (NtrC family)